MLDLITKSKIRQNILRFLFAYPNKEFYLSEIARKIKASVGTCQRELDRMVEVGIFKKGKKANLIFYSVNKQNPVFKEFSQIISKTIGIEAELKKLVSKLPGLKFAFIFGSYVKKDFKADSDLDICLIGNIDESKLIKKLRLLENKIGREVNYHLYAMKDFKVKLKSSSFLHNIIKNYLLLTDNQDEFKKLFR